MYVGLKMLPRGKFVTVTKETLVTDIQKLMVENHFWMMLVVEGDQLVGYVRKEDVSAALPSAATSLSKHEINYLLSKLKADKILKKDVPTVTPDTTIEEAAQRMHDEDLAGLAVVDRSSKLLGFINRSVMLEVLVEEMGLDQGGSRIAFEVVDRTGVIHEVSGIIADMGVSIIATGTFFHNDRRMVVFRVQTDDPKPIEKAIQDRGYTIVGPEDFEGEWTHL
ncbi:acetoin utilization protein [Oceanidesulfovibrio indonesiensis]|uniref:Acetoin utilization protein n=1 Tax=Oceanidesulfovibrio indonesiensis TaxID=54767 RepID=A0A7M3MDP9_9BACT|nr:CBS domain-containing protein [Oceanidesulfovibrio indonesiensis]TVM16845.1 acetoin utilization protein [Oceanidesulfovibrio indonesiensis]